MAEKIRKAGIVAIVIVALAVAGGLLIGKPWLQQRREIAALQEGISDHEESTLHAAKQMDGKWPNWKTADKVDGPLKSELWSLAASIMMYKKQVDSFISCTGKQLEYSPRVVELEKAIGALQERTQANQASDATSEPAPNAPSSAHQG